MTDWIRQGLLAPKLEADYNEVLGLLGESDVPEISNKSALLKYLRAAADRPGMYFGSCKVDNVKLHLDGWRAHRRVHSDEDAFADVFFEDFHSFVEEYYRDNRTVGWNGLIRENTETDEDGFRIFMSLLEKFASART